MATITPERLKLILDRHAAWLRGDPDGEQADLDGADLTGVNLERASLMRADLNGVILGYECVFARAEALEIAGKFGVTV